MQSNIDNKSEIWFTYNQKRYKVKEKSRRFTWVEKYCPPKKFFEWSDNPETWDWKNCDVSVVGMKDNKVRLVVRRQKILARTSHLAGNKIKLMLGLVITKVERPKFDYYHEPPEDNVENKTYGPDKGRWYIKLTNLNEEESESNITDCYLWYWSENENTVDQKIQKIYDELILKQGKPIPNEKIFDVKTDHSDKIFPVIYQSRVDALENYIRRIYWSKKGNEIEFSIVFNDEELRRFWFLDCIYRPYRRWKYGRVKDLESFITNVENEKPTEFQFPGIYSDDYTLKDDTIHEDRTWFWAKVPKHDIKYYYSNTNHPIVFVNTSNHAMAEHDTNHQFWKWEYAAWEEDSPLLTGEKSKKDVDQMLKDEAEKIISKNKIR